MLSIMCTCNVKAIHVMTINQIDTRVRLIPEVCCVCLTSSVVESNFLDKLDLRRTFLRINYSAELGKVPGYCVIYSMQSSKAVLGRAMH